MRVSVIPAEFGETIVMRILDPSATLVGLPDLGLRDGQSGDREKAAREAERAYFEHRPHRLREDDDALRVPAHDQQTRR